MKKQSSNVPSFQWALRPAGMALASVNGCGFRGGTKMHQLKVYQETHEMKPWNHYTQLVSFPYCNPEKTKSYFHRVFFYCWLYVGCCGLLVPRAHPVEVVASTWPWETYGSQGGVFRMLCSCGKFSTEIIPQKCHSSFRFEVFLNVMFATEMLFLCMLILMSTWFSRVVFIW